MLLGLVRLARDEDCLRIVFKLVKTGGFLLTLQEKLKNSPAAPQAPAGAGCADCAARLRR